MKGETALGFLQNFYGDVLGVLSAVYAAGIFSKRAAPRAAFFGMVTGTFLALYLDVYTGINFAYVGFFSFCYTLTSILVLSRLEKPLPKGRLSNLTIHTLSDVKGPWVGLASWPNLWKWAIGMAACWFTITGLWEWFVNVH